MAVNEVRQVLMNELGLTREAVRAEMRDIVRDCVDRSISQINLDDIIARQIRTALCGSPYYNADDSFNAAIKKAVEAEAVRLVEQNLTVTIERK